MSQTTLNTILVEILIIQRVHDCATIFVAGLDPATRPEGLCSNVEIFTPVVSVVCQTSYELIRQQQGGRNSTGSSFLTNVLSVLLARTIVGVDLMLPAPWRLLT